MFLQGCDGKVWEGEIFSMQKTALGFWLCLGLPMKHLPTCYVSKRQNQIMRAVLGPAGLIFQLPFKFPLCARVEVQACSIFVLFTRGMLMASLFPFQPPKSKLCISFLGGQFQKIFYVHPWP